MTPETPTQEFTRDSLKAAGWPPEALALLEGIPDHILAAELGPKQPPAPWCQRTLALLGTITDQELADQMGISRGCVTSMRRKRGVDACGHGPYWTPDNRRQLGTMPDAELAKQIGITRTAVAYQRKQAGIPRFSRKVQSHGCQIQ